jgi:hypothetical protein
MQIRIPLFTLMRIQILLFTLMQIRIHNQYPTLHFEAVTDPAILFLIKVTWILLLTFDFYADPNPAFHAL